ncbi:S24/S26 family peptidase [Streptococcus suis]|uniref:S24/S26 family peptidase n=1 Tax=Streptococcus suis TaxID=1307 RepID=UPI001ABE642B|nr:S24/S26 family peptidase [Streptococcus suis]MBO4125954.1 S24/S26 family peptidase [Streptococcus suis]WFA75217.1 S24/S26 family peptidase [Streptococcus suis]
MQKRSIEEHLALEGVHLLPAQGDSMYPALRNGDLVTLRPIPQISDLQIGDIVLYRREDGVLVLHRILKRMNTELVLNGDNCTYFEYPTQEQLIGILESYQRDGIQLTPQRLIHQFYLWFWYRPWRLRFFLLKVFRKLAKLRGR